LARPRRGHASGAGILNQSIIRTIQDGFGYYGNGDDSQLDFQINSDFGNNDNHISGGAFMEFVNLNSSNNVPRFQKSALTTQAILADYLIFWKSTSSNQSSTFLCVLGFDFETNTIGKAFSDNNILSIFTKNIDNNGSLSDYGQPEIANTFVHELGHQFGINTFGNEDSHIESIYFGEVISNDEHSKCVMSYGTHQEDNNAEFDSHYNNLPSSPGVAAFEDSCIGDIRGRIWPEN